MALKSHDGTSVVYSPLVKNGILYYYYTAYDVIMTTSVARVGSYSSV